MERFARFSSILRSRVLYKKLLLGNMISQLGDWLSYIAINVLALNQSSSQDADHFGAGLAIAGVFLAHSVPTALAAPFAGPIVDRYDRRSIQLYSYQICVLLTWGMWWAALHGSLVWVQVLLALRVFSSSFGVTARQATLPCLVTRDELYYANALNSALWSVLFTAGVALGGLLTALLSPETAILIDSFTFVIAYFVIWQLPSLSPYLPATAFANYQISKQQSFQDLSSNQMEDDAKIHIQDHTIEQRAAHTKGGILLAWKVAKSTPILLSAVCSKIPSVLIAGSGWIIFNLIVKERYPNNAGSILGLLVAARGIGMGIGPIILSNFLSAHSAVLLSAVSVSAFIWIDQVGMSALFLCLWGMGTGVNWVASTSSIQQLAPQHLLGRISSLDYLLFTLSQSIAVICTGWLSDVYASGHRTFAIISFIGLAFSFYLSRIDKRNINHEGL